MALPSSGTLSLNEIHVEAGGSSATLASINDSDIRDLIGKSSAAEMSFSEWYGASAANTTSTRLGGGATTTNQFANCNVSLSTGNKLVVIIPMYRVQSGSAISDTPTSVTVGGQSATQHVISNQNVASLGYGHINSIWVLETTLSGTQLVTGSTATGTGNNSCEVYEITGHTSATPHATSSSSNYTGTAGTTMSLGNISTVSGGTLLMGITATATGNSSAISTSPSTTVTDVVFSSLNQASARLDGTSAGSNAFTVTNTQSSFFNVVTASFK